VESTQFDRLARSVATAATRRGALRGLAAGLLGAAGLGVVRQDASARCGRQYDGCNDNKDCCHGLNCKTLQAPRAESGNFKGVCAYKRGCGKRNDFCQKNKDCCRNFRCNNKRCKRR
jgi:hypothetical protein